MWGECLAEKSYTKTLHHRIGPKVEFGTQDTYFNIFRFEEDTFFQKQKPAITFPRRIRPKVGFGTQDSYIEFNCFGEGVIFD